MPTKKCKTAPKVSIIFRNCSFPYTEKNCLGVATEQYHEYAFLFPGVGYIMESTVLPFKLFDTHFSDFQPMRANTFMALQLL